MSDASTMNVMNVLTQSYKTLFRFVGRLALLFLWLLSMPVQAAALGFGPLSLASSLGQALKADIPILLNDLDDMKNVHVVLASPVEYKQLGVQWQQELSGIRVLVQDKHTDRPMMQLRSISLIHAPMLSIVVKANKSGRGTYFKHYKILLDPAELSLPNMPAAKARDISVQSSQAGELDVDGSPALQEADVWARTWRYGPVQAGDSLSEIAYRLRRDKRFSNKQVMLSLYEKNSKAFVGGNINHLSKGVWLTVPRADVVERYADAEAMRKLSKLLQRKNPAKMIDQKRLPDVVKQVSKQLRYSGKISIAGVNEMAVLKQSLDQQFEKVHQNMMAGKLQMATLDQSVAKLSVSMQDVQHDVRRLQRELEIMKVSLNDVSGGGLMTWQFGLIILLLVLLAGLALMLWRKKHIEDESNGQNSMDERNDLDTMQDQLELQMVEQEQLNSLDQGHENITHTTDTQSFEPLADEVVQLLNQTEASLGQCDFEQAEQTLKQINIKWPDCLKALALTAQLYHETDRHDERNDLINGISEASDEQRWERFCYFLPSHVWNACFGDLPPPSGTQT